MVLLLFWLCYSKFRVSKFTRWIEIKRRRDKERLNLERINDFDKIKQNKTKLFKVFPDIHNYIVTDWKLKKTEKQQQL